MSVRSLSAGDSRGIGRCLISIPSLNLGIGTALAPEDRFDFAGASSTPTRGESGFTSGTGAVLAEVVDQALNQRLSARTTLIDVPRSVSRASSGVFWICLGDDRKELLSFLDLRWYLSWF